MTRGTSSPTAVHVFIAALDPLTERGVRSAIDEEVQIHVLAHSTGQEILATASADYRQGRTVAIVGDGVDYAALAALASRNPPTTAVVLAKHPTHLLQTSLAAIGAICLNDSIGNSTLISAIHAASSHKHSVLASDGTRLLDLSRLTPRELDVYEHLADGKSYHEIALSLHIGYETVRTHTSRICQKLGVQSRLEIVGVGRTPARNPLAG
jgi:DNA-binding NarL/FixJ family response regulator